MRNKNRETLHYDVFLSHNSKDKPAVRRLANILRKRQLRVWLDIEQLEPGGDWQKGLEDGVRASKAVAILIGKDGLGPWQAEEMKAVLQLAARRKKKLIPVLLRGASRKPRLPLFVTNCTWLDLRKGLTRKGIDKLIWGITGKKTSSENQTGSGRAEATKSKQVSKKVVLATTKLKHGAEKLVGREKELENLDKAWHDPKTHVVTIVAWGGVGKTALVVDWMARMATDGWRGAERVFDWSFYIQGTSETTSTSSDAFIAKALEFFGDPEIAQSAASPWDKGERLVQLVNEHKTLLVLDGIEPLQYPPGPLGGKFKDPALEALLKGLAQHNTGLCLVTTRESITDLAPFHETIAPEWSLEHLSEKAGAKLLFDVGVRRAGNVEVRADDRELQDATREVRGHALTLQLLGRYLAKAHNGDVRRRKLVKFQKADAKVQGGHAFKVMRAYEKWLGEAGEEGKRQLTVLHLLGLFDRPVDTGCLAALRREPAIEGLTEPLIGLSEDDWNYTLSNLWECGFITAHSDALTLDAHPLIREYFGNQLREKKPMAWREAHRRLYDHLCETTSNKQQPTLEDLQPLYQAVAHGCQADLYQHALETVLLGRIFMNDDYYSLKRLGAAAADLAALAWLFSLPWTVPEQALTPLQQAAVLCWAGIRLRALGRMEEAKAALLSGLERHKKLSSWEYAASTAGHTCSLCLVMGQIKEAVVYAREGVDFANLSEVSEQQVHRRATLGYALHQAGSFSDAERMFRDAEDFGRRVGSGSLGLDLIYGFRFCELLIEIGKISEAKVRATRPMNQARTCGYLLDLGYGHLVRGLIGCAEFQALKQNARNSTLLELDLAVDKLRKAVRHEYLIRALLARTRIFRLLDHSREAQSDLDEAWQIAERGGMRLFMADVLLHRGRLFRDKAALTEAAELIKECGYHRRDEELADAWEAAKNW